MGIMGNKKEGFRPGGFRITDAAIGVFAAAPEAKILDIGCGEGATVGYLLKKGYSAYGVDADGAAIEKARRARSDIADRFRLTASDALPFEDGFFDFVLLECSFSLLESPGETLKEVRRVLKRGGMLAVSDLYAKKTERTIRDNTQLRHFFSEQRLKRMVTEAGFEVALFEDYSDALVQMIGQMLFDGEREAFRECFGLTLTELRDIGSGYFLMAAEKKHV